MIIELNKEYSSKEVAEICEVSYQNFRQNREKQEQHLLNYFDYKKIRRGNGYYYIFTEQLANFVPFKKAKSAKRDKIIKSQIKKTIAKNNRQTGSNIARIICVNEEIVALNLKLNTLQNYTRENLKETGISYLCPPSSLRRYLNGVLDYGYNLKFLKLKKDIEGESYDRPHCK